MLTRPRSLALYLALGTLTAGLVAARAAASQTASDVAFDTAAWATVLERHQHDGGLDYAGLAADREVLDRFLAELEAARPESWPRADRLAFWVNAYNAVVAEHVLDRYPEIESVKAVDGFFDELRRPVAGEELTLDEIEERSRELDPRAHFAVVCASTSCPDLRHEPYVGAGIDEQLDEQTREFLADRDKGLRWESEDDVLWLSSIFKWYAGDFTGGSTVVAFFARGKIVDWILPYLPQPLANTLRVRDPAVKFLDYDWSLNDRPR